MRVAFYGGSFNPPHVAHVLAAAYARTRGFEHVVIAPVAHHAFHKKLESFEHRAHLCEVAFAPISGVSISRVESSLPRPNYTLHTVEELSRQNPNWRIELLMGADVLAEAERWYRFDELRTLAPLFVLGRANVNESCAPEPLLPNVSSTRIRVSLSRRSPDDVKWLAENVPAPVLKYIDENRLYGGTESGSS